MNLVILHGRLGADPSLTRTDNGTAKAILSVADNRKWVTDDGVVQEATNWSRCIVWARSAETIAEYMKKGDAIVLRGRVETREWTPNDSTEKRYITEIIVKEWEFGAKSNGGGARQDGESRDLQAGEVTDGVRGGRGRTNERGNRNTRTRR